MYDKDIVGI